MRKIFIFIILFLTVVLSAYSQSPDIFNYQAVIRDNNGELITNTDIGIRISILNASSTGALLFQETHATTTNSYGIVNIKVGAGSKAVGDINNIDWSSNKKFLKVEIDESGGTSYAEMGTVQLLSVPYASYANKAGKLGDDNIYSPGSDTLFVVKDHDGNVVFAVFPDGAAVYVNETAKGKVGGFAVSGRSPSKALEEEYLVVTADSTRVYVNEPVSGKGKVGGFAVSGRSPSKGTLNSLMDLTKENYFIGHQAGANNTTGLYNTFLGYNAGLENTEGDKNIFLGYNSGVSNINGDANIFIGDSAGIFNESGWHNIFVGTMAGSDNISGSKNISVGAYAGRGLVSGWNNLFIGEYAGAENTIGNSNVFLGNYSGLSNTEGSTNIFIGKLSGRNNTVGTNNIFMGLASGKLNEDGTENIFIGVQSGYNNVSGNLNTCIGFQSGYTLENSNYNTFLGFWSGRMNKSGELNTYIGAQAGEFADDGNLNVIVGAYAGSEDTIGNFNTFVGMRAGSKNSGDNNTLLGGFAGADNVDGNDNVYIGQASGEQSTGSQNVFIGNGTGYNNDGDYNVFIGNNAGNTMMGSNKLVIHNGDADSSSALIYGEFDNNILRFNGNLQGIKFLNSWGFDSSYVAEGNFMTFGQPGISEDFIGYKNNTFYFLDAPGGGDIADPDVLFGGNVFVDTGSVAIGITNPTERLEVGGNIKITGGSFIDDGTTISAPDYVFEPDYDLESIEEHAAFMWSNKHLPAVSSADEIKNSDGYNISERREQMLEELEKAHIYIEQLNDEIKLVQAENKELKHKLKEILELLGK